MLGRWRCWRSSRVFYVCARPCVPTESVEMKYVAVKKALIQATAVNGSPPVDWVEVAVRNGVTLLDGSSWFSAESAISYKVSDICIKCLLTIVHVRPRARVTCQPITVYLTLCLGFFIKPISRQETFIVNFYNPLRSNIARVVDCVHSANSLSVTVNKTFS